MLCGDSIARPDREKHEKVCSFHRSTFYLLHPPEKNQIDQDYV
jgi:hypothetical protein